MNIIFFGDFCTFYTWVGQMPGGQMSYHREQVRNFIVLPNKFCMSLVDSIPKQGIRDIIQNLFLYLVAWKIVGVKNMVYRSLSWPKLSRLQICFTDQDCGSRYKIRTILSMHDGLKNHLDLPCFYVDNSSRYKINNTNSALWLWLEAGPHLPQHRRGPQSHTHPRQGKTIRYLTFGFNIFIKKA